MSAKYSIRIIFFMTFVIFAQADRNKALKWGIAACGKISNDFVNSLATLSSADHQVVAVAARANSTRAKEFAKKFGIPKADAGYLNLATNPDVEIVYIGNINPQHFSTAKLMLEHGKNVLLEKPSTMNRHQLEELIELSQTKNVFFAEGLWSRYLPSYTFIRQQIINGKLGEIMSVDAELGNPRTDPRYLTKELGGGVILDFGVYGIDVLQWIFQQEPVHIKATGKLNDDGIDTDIKAEFSYGYNRKATLKLSISEALKNKIKIVGTEGSMEIPNFWFGTTVNDVVGKEHTWPLPTGAKYPFINTNRAGLAYEAESIRKYIRAGKKQSDEASHQVSLGIARVQDAIRRQIDVVTINDFDVNYISPNLQISQLIINDYCDHIH